MLCAICDAPAQNMCGGCREVSYCCKEHQLEHWKKKKHQHQCFGKIFSFIIQALEISLFGTNHNSEGQLQHILSMLEQKPPPVKIPNLSTPEKKQAVDQLLTTCYVTPLVRIHDKCFAAFLPGIFIGAFGTEEAGKLALLDAMVKMESLQEFVPSAHGYMCGPMRDKSFPLLNFEEHYSIAMYLSRYKEVHLLLNNMSTSNPIATPPSCIFIPPAGSPAGTGVELPRKETPIHVFYPSINRAAVTTNALNIVYLE